MNNLNDLLQKQREEFEKLPQTDVTTKDFLSSCQQEILEGIVEMIKSKKKELGPSPLSSSGLSVGATIIRDIEFKERGYVSEWDAGRKINDVIDDLKSQIESALSKNDE